MPAPLLTVADYEARAREMMPGVLFNAKFHMNTDNVGPFDSIKFRPRVLVDASAPDLSTEVLGHRISLPVMLAASGSHQLFHPDGELATARAAGAVGTLMGLSTVSNFSLEEVAQAATGPLWFQLYMFKDREVTASLISRAEKAGYKAIVFTVDNTSSTGFTRRQRSARWGDIPYGYVVQADSTHGNFRGLGIPELEHSTDNYAGSRERGLTWSDVDWARSVTSLPLVIKGVQTAEDARLCLDHGAQAVLVSNHGAMTAPSTRATIEALPEVADAVGDRLEVFFDGGVRSGADVLKALALGARAVFIGRAMLYGLVVNGEMGQISVLNILREELSAAMGFCGVPAVRTVPRGLVTGLVVHPNGNGIVSDLERLVQLLEQGHVAEGEFKTLKAKLINS